MKKSKENPTENSIDRKVEKKKGNQKPPQKRTPRAKLPSKFTAPLKTEVFVLSDEDWEQLKLRRNFDKGQSLKGIDRKLIEQSINGFCLAVNSGLSRAALKESLVKITTSMAKIRKSVKDLKAMVEIKEQFLVEEIFGIGFTVHDVDQDFFKAYQSIDEAFMGCLNGLPKSAGPKTDFLIPLFESLLQDLMMFSSQGLISRSDVDKRHNVSERIMTDIQFFEYLFELIMVKIDNPHKRTSIEHAFKSVIENHLKWQNQQQLKAKSEGTKSEL
jgi:hypothetical protein